MKYTTYLQILLFSLITYMVYIFVTFEKVEQFDRTSANYKPEKVLNSEIPELPELSDDERKEVHEKIREQRKELEKTMDIEKKSVEQMRDEVHKILDEIIETDSTVTITFNMTVPNPLIN